MAASRGKIVVDATKAYRVSPEVMAGALSSDIVAWGRPALLRQALQPTT
jgi:hypothetical protein